MIRQPAEACGRRQRAAAYRPSLDAMSDVPLPDRLATLRSDVRRAVLRRRRLLAAALAGAAVLAGLHAVAPPPPPTEPVLTAARDLPSGAVLGVDDLVVMRLPAGVAPDGATTRSDAVGRTLAAPVRRGEAVTDVRLIGPGLLDGYPGAVAVPLRIPDAGSVGLLRVGDRVDLWATDPQAGSGAAEGVARDVPVVALPAPDQDVASGLPGRLVVVAAPEEAVPGVVAHAARGLLGVTVSR